MGVCGQMMGRALCITSPPADKTLYTLIGSDGNGYAKPQLILSNVVLQMFNTALQED
jgi:hypothetical protein